MSLYRVIGFSIAEQNLREETIKQEKVSRNEKPTKQDVKETHSILRDFGIKVKIPEFNRLSDMLIWRKNVIKNLL